LDLCPNCLSTPLTAFLKLKRELVFPFIKVENSEKLGTFLYCMFLDPLNHKYACGNEDYLALRTILNEFSSVTLLFSTFRCAKHSR
jgi:hypothetical protein